ncbi:hypothetical protein DFJ73DRAFT_827751 [Zopfochytrium polystomum]|nr:hypothetical protein DFJ73DRAFT_827751 [Zopfochytrium polystomum]
MQNASGQQPQGGLLPFKQLQKQQQQSQQLNHTPRPRSNFFAIGGGPTLSSTSRSFFSPQNRPPVPHQAGQVHQQAGHSQQQQTLRQGFIIHAQGSSYKSAKSAHMRGEDATVSPQSGGMYSGLTKMPFTFGPAASSETLSLSPKQQALAVGANQNIQRTATSIGRPTNQVRQANTLFQRSTFGQFESAKGQNEGQKLQSNFEGSFPSSTEYCAGAGDGLGSPVLVDDSESESPHGNQESSTLSEDSEYLQTTITSRNHHGRSARVDAGSSKSRKLTASAPSPWNETLQDEQGQEETEPEFREGSEIAPSRAETLNSYGIQSRWIDGSQPGLTSVTSANTQRPHALTQSPTSPSGAMIRASSRRVGFETSQPAFQSQIQLHQSSSHSHPQHLSLAHRAQPYSQISVMQSEGEMDNEPQDLMMLAARMVVQTQDKQSKMINDLNAELDCCRATIINLERTSDLLSKSCVDLKANQKQLQASVEEAENTIKDLSDTCNLQETYRKEYEKVVKDFKAAKDKLVQSIERSKSSESEAVKDAEQLRAKLGDLADIAEFSSVRLKELNDAVDQKDGCITELKSQVATMEARMEQLRKSSTAELASAKSELDAYQSGLNTLKEALEALKSEYEQYKIDAENQKRIAIDNHTKVVDTLKMEYEKKLQELRENNSLEQRRLMAEHLEALTCIQSSYNDDRVKTSTFHQREIESQRVWHEAIVSEKNSLVMELKGEISRLETLNTDANAKTEELTSELNALKIDLNATMLREAHLADEIQNIKSTGQAEVTKLSAVRDSFAKSLEEKQLQIAKISFEIAEKNQNLEQLKAELTKYCSRESELAQELARCQSEELRLQGLLDEQKKMSDELALQLLEKSAVTASLEEQNFNSATELAEAAQQIEQLKGEIQLLSSSFTASEDQSIQIANTNNALRKTIEKLQLEASEKIRRESESLKRVEILSADLSAVQEELLRSKVSKDLIEAREKAIFAEAESLRAHLGNANTMIEALNKKYKESETRALDAERRVHELTLEYERHKIERQASAAALEKAESDAANMRKSTASLGDANEHLPTRNLLVSANHLAEPHSDEDGKANQPVNAEVQVLRSMPHRSRDVNKDEIPDQTVEEIIESISSEKNLVECVASLNNSQDTLSLDHPLKSQMPITATVKRKHFVRDSSIDGNESLSEPEQLLKIQKKTPKKLEKPAKRPGERERGKMARYQKPASKPAFPAAPGPVFRDEESTNRGRGKPSGSSKGKKSASISASLKEPGSGTVRSQLYFTNVGAVSHHPVKAAGASRRTISVPEATMQDEDDIFSMKF